MTACGSCGRTMSDGGPLCIEETHELVRRLRAVPELLADLELTLTRQDRLGSNQGGRRSSERPVPWKEQVPDVVWALGNTVTTWARELAAVHDMRIPAPPAPSRPRRAIPPGARSDAAGRPSADFDPPNRTLIDLRHAVAWVAEHSDKLRRLFDAVQAHDEITDAIAHARRVIDRPADLRFVGPCGADLGPADDHDQDHGEHDLGDGDRLTCDRDLYAAPGAEIVPCPECGAEHAVDQRREWLLSIVHDEHVTYAEASRALSWLVGQGLPESTIRNWVSRGQLDVSRYLHRRAGARPIYVTERQGPNDSPLVRVGDVIRLVAGDESTERDTPSTTTRS